MKLSKQRGASLGVRKFFISQRVVNEWNLLPQEVVDVNQFKNLLDKYWQRCGR